tara:strand:+ start:69 stop:587 length:519 start_codon:yes stop_codon:yes gene_type:complete
MARPRKLDEAKRAQICARWAAGEDKHDIAKAFNCHHSTVSKITKANGVTRSVKKAAKQAASRKDQADVVASYEAIEAGDLTDPIDAANWLFTATVISARRVATDPNYPGSEADRRKELASLAAAANKLMPMAELRAARKALREDAVDLEKGTGPEMKRAKSKSKRASRKTIR